jgi:hypothetical protein
MGFGYLTRLAWLRFIANQLPNPARKPGVHERAGDSSLRVLGEEKVLALVRLGLAPARDHH